MKEWPLIDVGALASAWPHGEWRELLSSGDDDVQAIQRAEAQSDQLTNIYNPHHISQGMLYH